MRENKTKTTKTVKVILPVLLGVFCSNLVFFNLVGIFNLSGIFNLTGTTDNVSALEYQNSTDIEFTFNPTVSVTVSGDLVINDLTPGTYSDSNIVTVTAGTNTPHGFTLMATAGTNATSSTTGTKLVNTENSNYAFDNLTSNKADLASFSDSTWGYSYSVDNGTTWISGDNDSAVAGYNGLPQDTNTDASARGNGGVTLASTNTNASSEIKFKIGAKAATSQPSGTYQNVVNFYAVANAGPTDPCAGANAYLYCNVKSLVKTSNGEPMTQTATDLLTTITTPTSTDHTQDTSNSGVYLYDATEFGDASDVDEGYDIYYYRGVLENSVGSYGSDGSAATYPNYVILDADGTKTTADTCWRIVRTTGSGGVKMIYNGTWTGSTCANSTTNANAITSGSSDGTSAFSGTSSTYRQIVRVGYTYNSTYATNSASTTTIANVFGTDETPNTNNANSDIKTYIEGWFPAISSYEGILEPSAGYCSDRTVYNNTSPYTLQSENTNITTYGTSGLDTLRFGSNIRNYYALSDNNGRKITLNCARDTVDLYTTASATGGNKQLSEPVALLTADEVSLAGSGSSSTTAGSVYNANSFLRSGSVFWLLSPYSRGSGGNAVVYYLNSNGYLNNISVNYAYGVRPAISLEVGTTAASGTGTATDPWVVTAP